MENRKKFLFYVSIILFSWVIVGIGSTSWKKQPCRDVVSHIHNSENNMFLNPGAIEAEIRRLHGGEVRKMPMGEINVGKIEYALEKNSYIRTAEVFKDITGRLIVDVELRKPFARVFNLDGSTFYIDKEFRKMKISSNWTPNVILVRGFILEPVTDGDTVMSKELNQVKNLLNYITANEFLQAHISEIIVGQNGEVSMRPVIGKEVIELGKPVNLEEKFDNLLLFYEQVLEKSNWYRYKRISVKWKGQVVASE